MMDKDLWCIVHATEPFGRVVHLYSGIVLSISVESVDGGRR